MLFTSAADHRESLLSVLAQRWQAWRSRREALAGLESCGADEVARMAHDLTLTTGELRTLARKGTDSADLLYRRMAQLGIEREAIACREPKALWDLQKNCSLCDSKGRCKHDFARGADPSAWRDYCPNDDTLGALAPVAMAWQRVHTTGASTATADDDHRRLHMSMLAVLFAALAWLLLLGTPTAGLRGTFAPSYIPAVTAPSTGPAVTCIDASCLSGQQLSALETLRTVQTQGWIASSEEQLASVPQASLIVQRVHAGQALTCSRLGGTTYYGFMYQNGCGDGGNAAAKLAGYQECRPMAGGGACLVN